MPLYDLREDHESAFATAVKNGQTRLALEYAALIIEKMQSEINSISSQLNDLSINTKTTAASTRKDAKQPTEASDV